ncbi:hypothetical protein [Niabella drilacis]|uniref:VRR-NUC domain-containing protein n=1 Tax=Niabella drilacis (strain DSM 25811 / CCM 8410 / CCUG 62505 / LMG 26954 / E90) TaxID=1285928 RepID=A0A1G6WD23_NIADE|nr:hypothetical protein [Niabella drilacis]SDD63751.1 hypothetical protein SAMN04487894_11186 [Niabella drilacis]
MTWTPCNANLGVADIHAVITSRFIAIEIKIGTDRLSRHQEKERLRVEGAGGVYFFVRTMEQFYDWYQEYCNSN